MTRRFREDSSRIVKANGIWVRRPMAVRQQGATWGDVAEIVGGTLIFLTLFLGLPFLLWLVAA